jgi:hypothetical protein
MAQFTMENDPKTQADIDTAKKFFGTWSEAAAVRASIQLAQVLARTAKNKVIILVNQNTGEDVHIRCT